jgi:hypothetical protein
MSGILGTGEVSILSRYMATMTAAIASTAASLLITVQTTSDRR